jgi:hypothetical protein
MVIYLLGRERMPRNIREIAKALFFFLVVLEFELRAFTLSHSTSPIFVMGIFKIGFHELCARVS